jgi:hypothetical protein
VSGLIASALAGERGVRSASATRVAAAWRRAAPRGTAPGATAALETGRRVGAGRVIEGAVAGDSAAISVTASLRDAGTVVARAAVTGPSDSLPAMARRLAARLLALGAGRDSARLAGSEPSLPALRAFLDGRSAYWRGRADSASDLMQRATVLDSAFAPAALEVLHLRRGGDDGERAARLALAGRARLTPADQALLDLWTGPSLTAPERIGRWQRAAATFPDRPEIWYGLADTYFHDGLSAGAGEPFRFAEEAFRRGWALDSAAQTARASGARAPLLAEPLRHLIELAQMRGDSAAVLSLTGRALASDSTSARAGYFRWHRAVALGPAAQDAFWRNPDAVDPGSFGRIFEFVESSGLGAADLARSADLDTRYWESQEPAAGQFQRGMVALDGGRPRDGGRLLANIQPGGVSGTRPQGWRLAEGGDAGEVGLALYWGGDTTRAAAAVARLLPLARGTSLEGDAARDQLEARCVLGAWRAARGDWAYVEGAVRRLRAARVRGLHDWDSTSMAHFTLLCARLLDASRASALGLPAARRALDSADAASRALEIDLPALGSNLVVAAVAERQGDLATALRAVRRRAGYYQLFPSWYLSTYLREEGRIAALAGDTAGAIRAYRHYLALRPDPEPEVRPEVEAVRARLAALQ